MPMSRVLPWLLATGLAALPLQARALIVPASDALAHVGSSVTVEGDVATAQVEADRLVLELAPVEPKSFRVVLVLALFSSLPRDPARIYAGKRVRVSGLVQRFQGRPEMVVESTSQIEIVDLAGAPTPTSTTTTVTTPSRATTASPPPTVTSSTGVPATLPREAPVATAPPAPTPTPVPTVSTPRPAAEPEPAPAPAEPAPRPLLTERIAAERCERARARWSDAATTLRARTSELTRCLDAGAFHCRAEAANLAPALADLEWAEQQVTDRCD